MGSAGLAREQRRELAPRPPAGILLERPAACDHQRDHRAREVFPERQRAGHGKHGQYIDPRLASAQILHDIDDDGRECDTDHGGPGAVLEQ